MEEGGLTRETAASVQALDYEEHIKRCRRLRARRYGANVFLNAEPNRPWPGPKKRGGRRERPPSGEGLKNPGAQETEYPKPPPSQLRAVGQ